MKLSDLNFIKLLPQFMRGDEAAIGLANGIDSLIPPLAAALKRLSTWDYIDELTEDELDALAWELNILWYDKAANTEIKRDVIKNSDMVFKTLGTKWAVENVINSYFGDGYITEWFEYDGEPGHFRVYSANPSVSNERVNEFLALLDKVKRASAKLDGIYITLTGELPLCAGMAVHDVNFETHTIGGSL